MTAVIIVVKYRILKRPIAYGIQKHTKRRAVKQSVMVLMDGIRAHFMPP